MNKHQTLVYIKYGKLISKINDTITDQTIRSDMIKFLNIIPGTLKQPVTLQFNSGIKKYKNNNKTRGIFIFPISKDLCSIFIDFDGNNYFKFNRNKWTIIDKNTIKQYIKLYPNDFNNIIE